MTTKCLKCGSVEIKGGLSDGHIYLNGDHLRIPPIRIDYSGEVIHLLKCMKCGLVWGFTKV